VENAVGMKKRAICPRENIPPESPPVERESQRRIFWIFIKILKEISYTTRDP
jgi:hypothetical protein